MLCLPAIANYGYRDGIIYEEFYNGDAQRFIVGGIKCIAFVL